MRGLDHIEGLGRSIGMLSRDGTRALNAWLKEAAAGLCEPAVAEIGQRVRAEVREKVASLLDQGLSQEDGEKRALEILGDAKSLNGKSLRTHLNPQEFMMVKGYLIPPNPSVVRFGWRHVLIIALPGLFGLLLFLAVSRLAPTIAQLSLAMFVMLSSTFIALLAATGFWIAKRFEKPPGTPLSEVLSRQLSLSYIAFTTLGVPFSLLYFTKFLMGGPGWLAALPDLMLPFCFITFLIISVLNLRRLRAKISQLEELGFQYVVPESMRVQKVEVQAIAVLASNQLDMDGISSAPNGAR